MFSTMGYGLRGGAHTFSGLASAWSCVLFFDVLVFFLTVVRAFQVWQAGRIVHVVLRDGIMYFWYTRHISSRMFVLMPLRSALSGANLLNIVTLLVGFPSI